VNFTAGPASSRGLDLIVAIGVLATPVAAHAQVPGRVIVEVVAEGGNARPLSGALVTIATAGVAVSADSDGMATLTGLAPGRYTVSVSALGFTDGRAEVDIANGRAFRLVVVLDAVPIPLAGLDVASRRVDAPGCGFSIAVSELDASVTDLPAAIDRVPGATVVRTGGPGSPTTVQLRGSAASQVLVLLDGVSINSPVTGTADLSTVDLESLERVVVLPGAQSARYGPRALGGVILLETRRATRPTAAFTVGAGSWGGRKISGSGTWPAAQKWTLSGGVRWDAAIGDFAYDVPVFRGGGEDTRANAQHERIGADARVERTGGVTTSLRVHGSRLERGSPGSIVQPSMTGHQGHERYGGTADALMGSAARGGSVRLGLQWQNATYADTAPPFGTAYDADTDVREGRASAEAWTDAGLLRLRGGVEWSRMDVTSTTIEPENLDIAAAGAWSRATGQLALGGTSVDLGVGVRVDRHDLVSDAPISPTADLALFFAGTTLSARWSQGFSPAGLGDLFFQEGVLVEPNPDLLPERVRNEVSVSLGQTIDIGVHSIELRLATYAADVDDMILWFPDYRFVWSPVNFDVSREGLEAGGGATLTLLGTQHDISANAAWSRIEYRGEALDGQVAYRPGFTADASLSIALPLGSLDPRWRHIGERRSAPGSDLNVLAPYDLLDIGLTLPLNLGSTTARLEVVASNVLDERAALLVDYPQPGRGWSARIRITPYR
jgi:outer membrane cobalamin receptor